MKRKVSITPAAMPLRTIAKKKEAFSAVPRINSKMVNSVLFSSSCGPLSSELFFAFSSLINRFWMAGSRPGAS